jgi:hypothetical protein
MHPQSLNVLVCYLLPGRERPKEFIESGCELHGEITLEVMREITKTNITFLLPCMGSGSSMGTCVWLDKAGN